LRVMRLSSGLRRYYRLMVGNRLSIRDNPIRGARSRPPLLDLRWGPTPTPVLMQKSGDFIARGNLAPARPGEKWEFVPTVKAGDKVSAGIFSGPFRSSISSIGSSSERRCRHRDGNHRRIFTVEDTLCMLDGRIPLTLMQVWPVGSPAAPEKLDPVSRLSPGRGSLTASSCNEAGQRDPGGLGPARPSRSSHLRGGLIRRSLYTSLRGTGNEMTDVLTEFPELMDPRTGFPLIERTS